MGPAATRAGSIGMTLRSRKTMNVIVIKTTTRPAVRQSVNRSIRFPYVDRSRSRRPSPAKLAVRASRKIAMAGKIGIHHANVRLLND